MKRCRFVSFRVLMLAPVFLIPAGGCQSAPPPAAGGSAETDPERAAAVEPHAQPAASTQTTFRQPWVEGVVPLGQLTQRPRQIEFRVPRFTTEEIETAAGEDIVVRFIIEPNGGVRYAEVTETPVPNRTEDMERLMRTWRFIPGDIRGEVPRTLAFMRIPVR
ncbi:MAG: hypothetical protein JJU00_17140 [Opitutales bacterium]|nr:hypothetical protein [Opitutales bacterium]